jgi:hypothetical protein
MRLIIFEKKLEIIFRSKKFLQKESKEILVIVRFMTLLGPYLYRCKDLSAHYQTEGWTKV